jgi:hypothetical protein
MARPEVVVPIQPAKRRRPRRSLISILVISLQLFDVCDVIEDYVMDTISCA